MTRNWRGLHGGLGRASKVTVTEPVEEYDIQPLKQAMDGVEDE